MQSPIFIFDHIAKQVMVAQPGPSQDQKVQEALAAQRGQMTSSGSSPAR